jgi:hypothetical protein
MNSPLKNDGFLQGRTYDTANVSGGTAFRLPRYSPETQTTPMFGPVDQSFFTDTFIPPELKNNGGDGGGKLSNAQQMGMIGGAMGIAQGLIGRKKRRAQQRAAKNEYQTRRTEFENLDTSNLSAGFKNSYANMENTYEDLTVNQQQAQFQAQQNQQSQANIMQNLRGAAGGSGIGGLAQALANQSQIANQKASASIGMQESANQRLAAQGAAQVQQMGAQGEMFAQQQRISGAGIARGLQADKTGTLLGMAQADKAAADQAIQESNAALFGGIGSIAGAALTGGVSSLLKPPS